MLGILVELQRRGASAIAQDPNDASSNPTTPSASTQTRGNSIPEIGGSEGGFIGLIVGLGVIFLGSCIGVFFLLRNWRHGGRTVRGKSGEVGVEAPTTDPSFPRRRGTLFGFRSHNAKQAGWMRAPGEDEDDEWDANDTLGTGPYDPGRGDPVKLERSAYGERSAPHGEVTVPNLEYASQTTLGQPKHDSSVSTVDLEAPAYVPRDDPFEPPARSTSPATLDDDSFAHYQTYIDHLNQREGQSRHMSMDSNETAVTFPGGTKFKEDL